MTRSGSECWLNTLGPPGGSMAQHTVWSRALLPNVPLWICFLRCCTPLWWGEKESSVDFLNIVLRPRPTGKIPCSSAWHPRHKHDAPGARSFYLEASAANPLIQLCQSLQMLILLPKTAFSPLRLRPFFCAGPSICTCIFISPGHSGVTLSVYTSPTTTLWYP